MHNVHNLLSSLVVLISIQSYLKRAYAYVGSLKGISAFYCNFKNAFLLALMKIDMNYKYVYDD